YEGQVGSSAMPFKRNPVKAERMCSLARYVSALPIVGFGNAANSILERTLDDSASRRIMIPEAFLAVDEMLLILRELAHKFVVHPDKIRENLDRYQEIAGTEGLLLELAKTGMDRQEAHRLIQSITIPTSKAKNGKGRASLIERLSSDRKIAE